MSAKLASDLKPGDSVCMMRALGRSLAGRGKIVEIRESQTEVRSRAGKYGNALMFLYYDLDKARRTAAAVRFRASTR